MFDQLFDFYFSYFNSLVYGLVSIVGIYGASRLLGRTRNRGPLLILLTCTTKLIVGLTFPLSNLLEDRYFLAYRMMQKVWLSLSLVDLVATMLLLLGILLMAQDFRALLDTRESENARE
ncbi:MAG: hypothetical protein ACSHYB_15110 [Roseibacillus sp.]